MKKFRKYIPTSRSRSDYVKAWFCSEKMGWIVRDKNKKEIFISELNFQGDYRPLRKGSGFPMEFPKLRKIISKNKKYKNKKHQKLPFKFPNLTEFFATSSTRA